MSDPLRVAVIGGGIAGATAALDLARRGVGVVLLERGETLGGLVASFAIGGTPIERFYHHVFPHESHVLGLIDELGLGDRLSWYPSSVGIYANGRVWPFTSPVDLLRFRPLPLVDRLATGVGALRLGRVREWQPLDAVPAIDWLRSYTSPRAAEVVWSPLLRAKFGPAAGDVPAAWMWGRFRQRAGARRGGAERLGYLRGGFVQVFDGVARELARLGADVRLGASAASIVVDGARVRGVTLAGADSTEVHVEADAVVFAGPLPALPPLLPVEVRDPRWSTIGGLGVQCVVLETRAPVTDVYWTNVCDPEVPFGGIIEHTNLLPVADYGRHVVYLSRYFTSAEAIGGTDPQEEADRWVDVLLDRFADRLRPDDVLARHVFRAAYAAPLVTVGHRDRIPPVRADVAGLYVVTTAQIYPEDRGMSEGVRMGRHVASMVVDDMVRADAQTA